MKIEIGKITDIFWSKGHYLRLFTTLEEKPDFKWFNISEDIVELTTTQNKLAKRLTICNFIRITFKTWWDDKALPVVELPLDDYEYKDNGGTYVVIKSPTHRYGL